MVPAYQPTRPPPSPRRRTSSPAPRLVMVSYGGGDLRGSLSPRRDKLPMTPCNSGNSRPCPDRSASPAAPRATWSGSAPGRLCSTATAPASQPLDLVGNVPTSRETRSPELDRCSSNGTFRSCSRRSARRRAARRAPAIASTIPAPRRRRRYWRRTRTPAQAPLHRRTRNI